MLSLTPLRFTPRIRMSKTPEDYGKVSTLPWYGRGQYRTDCGRFILHKSGNRWYVSSTGKQSNVGNLLVAAGLGGAFFPTRTELLRALEQFCAEESI